MPNKFVFPGGRWRPPMAVCRLRTKAEPVTLQKLKLRMRAKPSHAERAACSWRRSGRPMRKPGLLVGRRNVNDAPDLTGLIYFARAITPPGRSRRFDSRFLVANANVVSNLDQPHPLENDELLRVNWVTLAEAHGAQFALHYTGYFAASPAFSCAKRLAAGGLPGVVPLQPGQVLAG